MATYDLTPDNMRSLANQIKNLSGEYQSLYNNNLFQSLVDGDLNEAYKGTDAEAIVTRLKSYQVAFAAVKQQLDTYAEFLCTTATSYESKRDALAQEAATIGVN